MKHLLIIGARGWGREVYNMLPDCIGYGTEYEVKGFLDDKADALDGMPGYPPIIDSVEHYEPQMMCLHVPWVMLIGKSTMQRSF